MTDKVLVFIAATAYAFALLALVLGLWVIDVAVFYFIVKLLLALHSGLL